MIKNLKVFSIFILLLLTGSCQYFLPMEDKILAPPLVLPGEVTYNTATVKKGPIAETIRCLGHFVSVKQADISFKYRGGYLKNVYVKISQMVSQGQLLAELDTDSLEREIKQQELVTQNYGQIYSQLFEMGDVDTELNQIQLEELKAELKIMNAIPGSTTKSDLEKLENQVKKQELQIKKTMYNYANQLLQAKQNYEIASIILEDKKLTLNKSQLHAPIAGKIDYISEINIGKYVDAHSTFIRIADPTKLQLEYNRENYSSFKIGMEVDVKYTDKTYIGKVIMTPHSVPPEVYEKFKTTIRFHVYELPLTTKIAQSANITLTLAKNEKALIIPKSTVKIFAQRKFVKIIEDGMISERDIETGIESATEYEVVKGLEEGEVIQLF